MTKTTTTISIEEVLENLREHYRERERRLQEMESIVAELNKDEVFTEEFRQTDREIRKAANLPTFEELVKQGRVDPEIEEEYGTSFKGNYDETTGENHISRSSARLIVVHTVKGTGRSFGYNENNDIVESVTPPFVLGLEN